jgi:hypothetical protein
MVLIIFFSYITIVVNLYSTSFCVYWFFSLYNTDFFFSYITIIVNLYCTAHGKKKKKISFDFCVYSIY